MNREQNTTVEGAKHMYIAWDRSEDDACQRGTTGCCVNHSNGYETCETW